MQNGEGLSQEQIQEFLRSSEPIEFAFGAREERYAWVEPVLAAQKYGELGQRQRGLVRAYVQKVTGLSAAQTTVDPGVSGSRKHTCAALPAVPLRGKIHHPRPRAAG